MSKRVNLVVFIDGTGNNDFKKAKDERTNVARLWHACENAATVEVDQRVFYRPGVGTRRGELIDGNVVGKRLGDRVEEALSWLHNEIKIAEEDGLTPYVYLFGFSRGAYAVRWLATRLNREIEVLGCWDTVKATISGPDVDEVGPHVKHVFHAIAIDEHRKLFEVTRFKKSPQVAEVWFPGCHSDVGGGYKESQLSFVSLNWMARLVTKCGLLVDWDKIPEEPVFSAMPVVHDETRKFLWWMISLNIIDHYSNRNITSIDVVHPSAYELKTFGYVPNYLPQNCLAWNDTNEMGDFA